jgi:hypothetical protein
VRVGEDFLFELFISEKLYIVSHARFFIAEFLLQIRMELIELRDYHSVLTDNIRLEVGKEYYVPDVRIQVKVSGFSKDIEIIAGRFWSVRRLVETCKTTFQRSESLVIAYYGMILDREKPLSHWDIGNGAQLFLIVDPSACLSLKRIQSATFYGTLQGEGWPYAFINTEGWMMGWKFDPLLKIEDVEKQLTPIMGPIGFKLRSKRLPRDGCIKEYVTEVIHVFTKYPRCRKCGRRPCKCGSRPGSVL